MRFIHTADWHLGRNFHGVPLIDDQAYVLRQFTQLVRDTRPDAVVIAGDIYDRPIPSPDAVSLLDAVLSELVLDIDVPVLLIAGNHDSAGRLNFARRLLAGRKLYVAGTLRDPCEPILLEDAHGPVGFYLLPFAEPGRVRECFQCQEAIDHQTAMQFMLDRIRAATTQPSCKPHRKVLVGHAFVAGAAECESERPLSVGTAGTVNAGCFTGFDYVALGHLHQAQTIHGAAVDSAGNSSDDVTARIRYSGSPVKYSFDEAYHEKTVFVVDMSADGLSVCEPVAMKPRRDVRREDGLFADLLNGSAAGKSAEDYLEITLLDEGPVLDAMGRLRAVYPNILLLRTRRSEAVAATAERPQVDVKHHRELFKGFFEHATGEPMTLDQEKAYADVVEAMFTAERDA